MTPEDDKRIVNYFHEIAQLKMVKRSGWWVVGVKDPESVAEHSHRAAIISYFLAKMEGADAKKCALISLFHDSPETRIGDMHKITARYIDGRKSEAAAWKDQLEAMPKEIADELRELIGEYEEIRTKEAIIAKDADVLECAFDAIRKGVI